MAIGGLGWQLGRGTPAPVAPTMGNAGNVGQSGGAAAPAPDISQMSPMERFTRLNDRVMQAAEIRDTITVVNFTPMALGAYTQLDTIDVDLRYHAAVLHAQIGEFAPAVALADTILQVAPENLFGYLLRATVAQMQGDRAGAATARDQFLAAWDRQIALNRPEYIDHRNVLEAFREAP